MQDAATVLDVLRERTHGIDHWRAVMRGNPHVRFGPEAAGKGPAACRHLAGVLPVPVILAHYAFGDQDSWCRSATCPPGEEIAVEDLVVARRR